MKMFRLFLIAAALFLFSCQSKEEKTAQGAVDRYIVFVDSVNKAKYERRRERWDFIEEEHNRKRKDAEEALSKFKEKDREKQRRRITERDEKYEGIKASVEK